MNKEPGLSKMQAELIRLMIDIQKLEFYSFLTIHYSNSE